MKTVKKIKVSCYTMKMRLYPSEDVARQFEETFRALHVAYNITFHEVFEQNPAVCTEPNSDGMVWPDFRKMAKADWKKHLIEVNPIVGSAPAAAITTNNGLFLSDAKRAWITAMHNLPVNKASRKEFRFYSQAKTRTSFSVQIEAKNIVQSTDNPKVAWLSIPKFGKVKARGFDRKLWFGEDANLSYSEAVKEGKIGNLLTLKVSKDNCGDYYVSLTISEGKKHEFNIFREIMCEDDVTDIGIDVGIKDIAILSDGTKYPNKHFKREYDSTLRKLNRKLARRWGPGNVAYRDYNKFIKDENKKLSDEDKKALAVPSKNYLETKMRKAKLERKILRKRETYQHVISNRITCKANRIAVETLQVKNMLKNHKLAYALSDAGMSNLTSKIKYKAERLGKEVTEIGTFEPSSQRCSECGFINNKVKDLSVRNWVCPECGAEHDRDINAAKSILQISYQMRDKKDIAKKSEDSKNKVKKQQQNKKKVPKDAVLIDNPDIVIRFSKELTTRNNPRYIIINKKTGDVLDDAQSCGYKSISNAKNCYKSKIKRNSNK